MVSIQPVSFGVSASIAVTLLVIRVFPYSKANQELARYYFVLLVKGSWVIFDYGPCFAHFLPVSALWSANGL